MLQSIIKKYIESPGRNRISKLEKEVLQNHKLFKEYTKVSNPKLTTKNNLYNIFHNVTCNICPVCCHNETKWNEKDFCYRKTCSYKCSGKLDKPGKRMYYFPEIKTKEHFTSLVKENKIKTASIKKTAFYHEVLNIKGSSLSEKVWRWMNDRYDNPICANLDCANPVKFVNNVIGFREFCSVKCSSSSEKKIQKIKETCLTKWGVNNPSKRNLHIDRYKTILSDFIIVSYDNSIFVLDHHICQRRIEITRRMVYDRWNSKTEICTSCNPIGTMKSGLEGQLVNWLRDLGIRVIENDREIIAPKELDIFLPDFAIAIEFNGLYWHSEDYVGVNYHINKTSSCAERGVQLLHIWEDDWLIKPHIVKSIILNKLGINSRKIFARNCHIKEVTDNKIVRDFLNENHIQGFCKSGTKLGLFLEDELVSLMTFGWRKTNRKREFELIRFCNKTSVSVPGSASKLFSYFIKNYEYEKIVSYADVSLFDGSLYKTLGFDFIHRTNPNYFWVVDGIRHHRWKFNKQKLVQLGFDGNKTEDQIMTENGNFKVFSCGQDRWEYYKKTQ